MEDILIKTDERELEGLREKRENSSGNSRVTLPPKIFHIMKKIYIDSVGVEPTKNS